MLILSLSRPPLALMKILMLFDTSVVDSVIEDALMANHDALVVIKSTIPVGHTEYLLKNIIPLIVLFFLLEFLKRGECTKR